MRRRTVRVRLTVVYSGLFLATSTIMLIVVNLVLEANLRRRIAHSGVAMVADSRTPPTGPSAPGTSIVAEQATIIHDMRGVPATVLRYQWVITGVIIAVLTIVSLAGGWWLAGRLLRPLHHITATARRLSLSNLHERIALAGPRDELTELADTFDTMLDRLQASVDSQRRFAANASHELRTPLAIQRAAIQIGLDSPSPEKLAEVREELLEVNRRSERLIDGLLILAQGEHGLEATEPVALDTLVHQAVGEVPSDGLDIKQHTEPAMVTGDPVLLYRLVANLIHNAVRYNRPGGVVDVLVTADGCLTVRNTGPDVPADLISELFEPFRRLRTARTRSADSTGLGLSIVASIAQAHRADIIARPNPGGGLELTVRFHPPAAGPTGACGAPEGV